MTQCDSVLRRLEIKNLRHRLFLPIFLLLAIACASDGVGPALAQDFIAGTVVSADIEKMEIEIIPIVNAPTNVDGKEKKYVIARLSDENLVVNRLGKRIFPGCVYPGGVIRLWGHMDQGVFLATDIRGWGGRGRSDPTGVRRRLLRGGGRNSPGGPGVHGGRP